ncbi:MAG: UbiA family prenyltransferase [Ardenticatenaceae bacterium]|nr:UbiA family prenyltransferase [Ardenticatenaceae bacterium]MCB9445488.1 UbiA family prenyltransferase [Ardenticatenaceae bacterium]
MNDATALSTKIRGLARLFRFELPFAAGICVLLGELLALGHFPSLSAVGLGFGSVFCISASALILNDYFDIESDQINAPQRPLPSGMVTPRDVIVLSVVVTLLGLTLSYLISVTALLVAVLVWLVGFLYNWRFKKTGLPGNLMVSFSVGMTFVFGGVVVARPFHPIAWFFAIIAALINLGEEIAADAMDSAGDQQAGSRSLAIRWGPEKALRISSTLFILVVLLSSLPFLFGWLPPIYLLPISLMDGSILYGTIQLLNPRQPDKRDYIRWIYLGASAGMLLFLIMRLII